MFWIPLEKASAKPLIRQVYEHLRAQILAGILPGGIQLPSTRELASNLHISRNVVLEAYDQLCAEGYIESRAGSGTYVVEGIFIEREQGEPMLPPVLPLSSPQEKMYGIDFRSGLPALDLLPRKQWSQFAQQVYTQTEAAVFGYDHPQGRPELRHVLARYLQRTRGVVCQAEQIVILSGATQAFHLLNRLLLAPGDEVVIEDPAHYEVQMIFATSGARLIPVPVDGYGIQTDLLPEGRQPRCLLVTPSHQFPQGSILPIQRRLQLLQFACNTASYVVEDDYDSEFRYVGSPISSLQGLAPERVIYVGTFSKILFPALRLGYLVLPPELIERARKVKRLLDLHSPSLEQLILARFIESGSLDRHIVRMKRVYQRRRNVLINALKQHFSPQVEILGDAAGLHLVARFPQVIFTAEVIAELASAGASVYPVEQHAIVKGRHQQEIILGYSHLTPEQIEQGIQALKVALDTCI